MGWREQLVLAAYVAFGVSVGLLMLAAITLPFYCLAVGCR